jgi:hypothetical protein
VACSGGVVVCDFTLNHTLVSTKVHCILKRILPGELEFSQAG